MQLYSTPWFLHLGLLPIDSSLQPGQGKDVDPSSTSGTPDDVQFTAFSLMNMPQEQTCPRPSLLYACVRLQSINSQKLVDLSVNYSQLTC